VDQLTIKAVVRKTTAPFGIGTVAPERQINQAANDSSSDVCVARMIEVSSRCENTASLTDEDLRDELFSRLEKLIVKHPEIVVVAAEAVGQLS